MIQLRFRGHNVSVNFGGAELLPHLLDAAVCSVVCNIVVALVAVDVFICTNEDNARVTALFIMVKRMLLATPATPKVLAVQASPDALCRPTFR